MSMSIAQTRRRFLTTLSLAGAAGFRWARRGRLAAEGSSRKTTTVRLTKGPGDLPWLLNTSPRKLLRAEGFLPIDPLRSMRRPASCRLGKADFTLAYASNFLRQIDAGDPDQPCCPGLWSGCVSNCSEMKASHGIPDLKGKDRRRAGHMGVRSATRSC